MKIISKNKNPKNLEVLEDNNRIKIEERWILPFQKYDENFMKFKAFLEDSSDVFREFKLGSGYTLCSGFIDGLVILVIMKIYQKPNV